MTKQFDVEVTQTIRVTLDESKFDDAFMEEFRESFFKFDTLERHAAHIGRLFALGIIDLAVSDEFIEGYGPADGMGIRAEEIGEDTYARVLP